jgi:ketosteroid isomerase-like protein
MIPTEPNRKLVQRFIDARNANDYEAITELLADDVEFHPPASLPFGPFIGRDSVTTALTGGAVGDVLDMSSIRRTVRKIVADDDTVVVLQGLTASTLAGEPYANEYCWAYTCADGHITRMQEFVDTLRAAPIFGWR